jgi:transcriptional regulator with XRE-family HTH domain
MKVIDMLKSLQEVGNTIKDLRIKKGLTQDQLATMIQLTPQTVSKWENGDSYRDLQIIGILTEIFEVSMDELMNKKSSKEFKQHYRIHETIENDMCAIKIKNATPYKPFEITLCI